ncbi:nuclease-related domain-containing protein [Kitasatospora sp. NPDC127116]|uniref:nuclease-related domain-containing protein n=1 Tax=Kitasatospora sp. NPDC127116 TaxID=3345367 RepID=UPI0036314CB4
MGPIRRLRIAAICAGTGWLVASLMRSGYGSVGAVAGLFAAALYIVARSGAFNSNDAARRWEAGARGERSTARILDRLAASGWTVMHDRGIPGSKANLDHLAIGPDGQVVLVDSKQWSGKGAAAVSLRSGRLMCGRYDRQKTVETLQWEASRVEAALGVPVTAVIAVHGAPVKGGRLLVADVQVVGPRRLVDAVMSAPAGPAPTAVLARRAEDGFPQYA